MFHAIGQRQPVGSQTWAAGGWFESTRHVWTISGIIMENHYPLKLFRVLNIIDGMTAGESLSHWSASTTTCENPIWHKYKDHTWTACTSVLMYIELFSKSRLMHPDAFSNQCSCGAWSWNSARSVQIESLRHQDVNRTRACVLYKWDIHLRSYSLNLSVNDSANEID